MINSIRAQIDLVHPFYKSFCKRCFCILTRSCISFSCIILHLASYIPSCLFCGVSLLGTNLSILNCKKAWLHITSTTLCGKGFSSWPVLVARMNDKFNHKLREVFRAPLAISNKLQAFSYRLVQSMQTQAGDSRSLFAVPIISVVCSSHILTTKLTAVKKMNQSFFHK